MSGQEGGASGASPDGSVMMGADELRKAAKTLRARAGKATDGPWCIEQNWIDMGVPDNTQTLRNAGDHRIVGDVYLHYADVDNGTYIATVHPGVGLALADWLDGYAGQCGFLRTEPNASALTVARAINGGAE